MKVVAVIVAAGSGQRAGGDLPKQFQDLAVKNTDLGFTVTESENAFTDLLKILTVF